MSQTKPRIRLPFPFLLHDMLDNAEQTGMQSIVSWMPHGRSFRVHDVDMFVESIMKDYFQSTKFKSFTRQLYLYGFKRLEDGAYYHCHFVQRDRSACFEIRRFASTKSSKPAKKEDKRPEPATSIAPNPTPTASQSKAKAYKVIKTRPSVNNTLFIPKTQDMPISKKKMTAALSIFQTFSPFNGANRSGNLEQQFQNFQQGTGRIRIYRETSVSVMTIDPDPLPAAHSSSLQEITPPEYNVQDSSSPMEYSFLDLNQKHLLNSINIEPDPLPEEQDAKTDALLGVKSPGRFPPQNQAYSSSPAYIQPFPIPSSISPLESHFDCGSSSCFRDLTWQGQPANTLIPGNLSDIVASLPPQGRAFSDTGSINSDIFSD
jgi:hypothetical protein